MTPLSSLTMKLSTTTPGVSRPTAGPRPHSCPALPDALSNPALCRFSGVTEADLVDTSITLRDVQAVLLSMFSADTILIGHSLESDLLALKVAAPAG